MTPNRYAKIRRQVADAGYGEEIRWAQGVKAPTNADDFAAEVIWVICCSGMKEQVARIVQRRVWAAIKARRSVKGSVLGKSGKADAIDEIWRDRAALFARCRHLRRHGLAVELLAFFESLPWIGPITKYHLAKNCGVDCAKPDVHLERLARHYGTTPAALCAKLARATGDRIATVDVVLWRASNLGIIKTRELNG